MKLQRPTKVVVRGGWNGEIADILAILEKDARDKSRVARPLRAIIYRAVRIDAAFNDAMSRGDRHAAAMRLREIAERIIEPGIEPRNKPGTARRKGGDDRALRDVRGRDRVYKTFETDPETQ